MASADGSGVTGLDFEASQLIVLAIMLFVGVVVVSQVIPSGGGANVDGIQRISGGQVTLQDYGTDRGAPEVRDSTGRAVSLDGSDDAEVRADTGLDTQASTYSVTTWVAVNDTSRNQTVGQFGDGLAIEYRQDLDAWRVWVYNRSSTNSYAVTLSAPQPGSLTRLAVVRSSTTSLTAYRNESAQASLTLTPGSTATATAPVESPLNGTIEETRTFATALNTSQRQTTYFDPVRPVNGTAPTARLMYDGTGSDLIVGFGGTGSITSGERTAGFAGSTVQQSGNYSTSLSGADLVLSIASGGVLEGAPQLVIQAPDGSGGTQLVLLLGRVFQLAAVLLVLVVAATIARIGGAL